MASKPDPTFDLVPMLEATRLSAVELGRSRQLTRQERQLQEQEDLLEFEQELLRDRAREIAAILQQIHITIQLTASHTSATLLAISESAQGKKHQVFMERFTEKQLDRLAAELLALGNISTQELFRYLRVHLRVPQEQLSLLARLRGGR
jgi:hypothetical protein